MRDVIRIPAADCVRLPTVRGQPNMDEDCSGRIYSVGLLTSALSMTRTITVFRQLKAKATFSAKFNWVLAVTMAVTPQILNVFFISSNVAENCYDIDENYL